MNSTRRRGDSPAFWPLRDILTPLDWAQVFPKVQPVHLDLGAGDGGFISQFARQHPELNCFAVERLLGRARKIARRADRFELKNLRVLRIETFYFLRFLVPARSVQVIHVMHPDPWPKKKQQRRRLFQLDFIDACADALEPGGELRVVSDHPGYFKEILDRMLERQDFERMPWQPPSEYPRSDFETHFGEQNKVVIRQAWRWKGVAR